MKKLFRISALIGVLCASALMPARAMTFEQPQIFWLTNSPFTFTPTNGLQSITNGSLTIGPTGNSNLLSATFPIVRDRGFNLNLATYLTATNYAVVTNGLATNGAVVAVFRFGTIHSTNAVSGGGLVTNWSTYLSYTNLTAGMTVAAGAIESNACFQVNATTVQNYSIGQLYSLWNDSTNSVAVDPTNSYVSLSP